ncbi:uncharacterized protein LY89DRAFT_740554 [Mollisia scopiformis]|uniref:Protein kinase domain-containing protein n=1 Tax=Mollisia scopiformis TaxID=149040 RepID=A0A132BD34_MOLSC|nr:uncharacterized protein LY89DRAFT_740554 [Mollisia scopiformis]KUJ10163.1 hypothetical protein LY89DRAFT_740554 [Mollisia scopiformis]
MLGFDSKTQVVHFDHRHDHPGYILIRTIDKGFQSQTTLVRSLQDGNVYIRKHLNANENSGAELLVRNLPTDVAPRLIDYTNTLDRNQNDDVFIYEYCNGGDLADLHTKYLNHHTKIRFLPGALLWDIARQCAEKIAYIHSGWQYGQGVQVGWEPFIHGDISPSNTFLDWNSDSSPYPQVLLGDWRIARTFKEPKGRDMASWREYQSIDLQCFLELLVSIDNEAQIRTPDVQNPTPSQLFEDIGAEGEKWELRPENKGSSIAAYIADKFIEKARTRIRDFESQEASGDLRWTMPNAVIGFATFDKNGPPPTIKQPWEWRNLDQLPIGFGA